MYSNHGNKAMTSCGIRTRGEVGTNSNFSQVCLTRNIDSCLPGLELHTVRCGECWMHMNVNKFRTVHEGVTDLVSPSTHSTKQGCSLGNQQKPTVTIAGGRLRRSCICFHFIFPASTKLCRGKARVNIRKLEQQPGGEGRDRNQVGSGMPGLASEKWNTLSLLPEMEGVPCGSPFPSEGGA